LKEGIVLIAHGSRDPEWSRPFERIAARVAEKLPAVTVALAYLEHGPSFDEALAALAGKGVASVRVVPLFLGPGGHVREDLPALVKRAGAAHAQMQLLLEKPIGEQPALVDAIAEGIAAPR